MAIKIRLKGGPCDGEAHDNVRSEARAVTRKAKGPDTLYEDSGEVDPADGRRIFAHKPRQTRPSGRG